MIRVGIVGATGYAGADLVRILTGHPDITLTCLTSRQYAGKRFDHVYPAMSGWTDLTCQVYDAQMLTQETDLVFMALPHQLPMTLVPELLQKGIKIVDLSADFRFQDANVYEAHYKPHTAAALLAKAVYGLSEVYADKIKTAELVGNPGCYPTSVLLPLTPLIKADLIHTHTIVADAKSGVSGAGRSATMGTHYCHVNESFKPYKVGRHRHTPEMEAILSEQAGKPLRLTFVPHLIPMTRGMQTTIYTTARDGVRAEDIQACLTKYYNDRPFVRLRSESMPDTLHVKGTNCCDIGFHLMPDHQRLILISAIDNLVKGAAGQAVQNMNIMLGFDETRGLLPVPYVL